MIEEKVLSGSTYFTLKSNDGIIWSAYMETSGYLHEVHFDLEIDSDDWGLQERKDIIKFIKNYGKKEKQNRLNELSNKIDLTLGKKDYPCRLYISIIIKMQSMDINITEFINNAIIEKLERDNL